MRLVFATLARAAVLHADDELTIARLFYRVSVPRGATTPSFPESVVATELEAEGVAEETERLYLDVLDADGRFATRLYQVLIRLSRSTDGLPVRRFHMIVIAGDTIALPPNLRLPQRMMLRLRLGARDVAMLGVSLI